MRVDRGMIVIRLPGQARGTSFRKSGCRETRGVRRPGNDTTKNAMDTHEDRGRVLTLEQVLFASGGLTAPEGTGRRHRSVCVAGRVLLAASFANKKSPSPPAASVSSSSESSSCLGGRAGRVMCTRSSACSTTLTSIPPCTSSTARGSLMNRSLSASSFQHASHGRAGDASARASFFSVRAGDSWISTLPE